MNWKYVACFLNKNSEILLELVSCGMCYQAGYSFIPGIDSSWQIKCLFLLDTSKCHPLLRHFMLNISCVRGPQEEQEVGETALG